MTRKGTIKRYTLDEIDAMIARGEDRTREDAVGDDFWKNAVLRATYEAHKDKRRAS